MSDFSPSPPERRPTLYEMIDSQGYISIDSMEGGTAIDDAMDVSRPVDLHDYGTHWWKLLPGVGIAVLVTLLASLIKELPFPPFTLEGAQLEHPFGTSILAILLGIGLASWVKFSANVRLGCRWISAWFIPIAIICLGARMDLGVLTRLGIPMLGMVVGIMLVAILASLLLGKCFGLSKQASYLLGVGSAVCGSSAVLAVAPLSDADDDDVVLAVGAVNLIGLLAMFSCVGLIWWMPAIGAEMFGSLSGATIHAVPQVVAAAESHGSDASTIASAVKLLRVSLLVPVVLLSALLLARNARSGSMKQQPTRALHKYIPWFVWGFVLMSVLAASHWIPNLVFPNSGETYATVDGLSVLSKWLLAIAMAAIGLQVDLKKLVKSGGRALACALTVWLIMAASAYGMFQLYFG